MKKILIIRLDGLGDTLLTTPLLDSLRRTWPNCEIVYLASRRGAPVFEDDPRINDLWIHELSEMPFAEKWQLGCRIRTQRFDTVFCLNEKFWPGVWTRLSGAKTRIGFDPGWTQPPKTLLRRLTLTHRVVDPNNPSCPSIHEVQRYALLGREAGCSDEPGPLHMVLSERAWKRAEELLKTMALPPHAIPVCFHLSSKWTSDGYGARACLAVAEALLDRLEHVFLVVTTGPDEENLFREAQQVLPASRFHLLTALPFMEWASVIAQCRAVVTMDTGAVHLAAAVGTPVVDVFPEKHFIHASVRWAPWQVPHRIVRRPNVSGNPEYLSAIRVALEELL